jgi:hypothetical protein
MYRRVANSADSLPYGSLFSEALRAARGARIPITRLADGKLKILSQVTAENKREYLIVFGEEDPVSGTHTKPARTRPTRDLLEP